MSTFPVYQPLKPEFTFDSDVLVKEIDALIREQAEERTLPFENGRSVYDPNGLLKVADDEVLNSATKYKVEDGKRIPIPGKLKTYHVLNLTYLPDEPDSLVDIYRSDDPKKEIFSHRHRCPFVWRKELEGTAIKAAVTQFPWKYVQAVRLIYMSPPSVGQIHRDSHPLSNLKYYRDGFASISFNIRDGGGVMQYLDDNKQHAVDNAVKVFHFNDSVPHGVTPITSDRYQLRMWGKLAVPYTELFDV